MTSFRARDQRLRNGMSEVRGRKAIIEHGSLKIKDRPNSKLPKGSQPARPCDDAELRLRHPVDDLVDAIGRLDEKHNRVSGRKILHCANVMLCKPAPCFGVDAVDHFKRRRCVGFKDFRVFAFEEVQFRRAGVPADPGQAQTR